MEKVQTQRLVPFLFGRPFLSTSEAKVNCRNGEMVIFFEDNLATYNIFARKRKGEVSVVDRGKTEKRGHQSRVKSAIL